MIHWTAMQAHDQRVRARSLWLQYPPLDFESVGRFPAEVLHHGYSCSLFGIRQIEGSHASIDPGANYRDCRSALEAFANEYAIAGFVEARDSCISTTGAD